MSVGRQIIGYAILADDDGNMVRHAVIMEPSAHFEMVPPYIASLLIGGEAKSSKAPPAS
jgi:hypothetical protein